MPSLAKEVTRPAHIQELEVNLTCWWEELQSQIAKDMAIQEGEFFVVS